MIPQVLPIRYVFNPDAVRDRPYGPAEGSVLNAEAHEDALREIASWEAYAPTPLRELRELARRLGVASVLYKDEGPRLGLGSFKGLGGTYGVLRALKARGSLGDPGVTVTCASAGNHGRAVAKGAAMFGCRCVIFLPERTDPPRSAAIRALGARVELVPGSYDDAVALAQARAQEAGWVVVSDTAYAGYEEIPRHIMQGYTVMVREVLDVLPPAERPTHVFVQGGVGGLAGAVTGHLWESLGTQRPTIVVVEPAEADCLLESALHRSPTPSRGTLDTSMECLACRNPSTLAWVLLQGGADAFLSIPDPAVEETVALLASGAAGGPPLLTQPSGAAGLTGLIAALHEPSLSTPLALGAGSRVLLIGSEGPREGAPSSP